ncbi:MAG: hypothetical protein AAF389_10605 [Gemmatimonadota bacterium]
MRSIVRTLALLGALGLPTLASAQIPIAVELPFRTKYYFAGVPFAAAEVQQAHISTTWGAVTVHAFGVYDVDAGAVTEGDLYADWYRQLTPSLGFFVGGAWYNFDFGDAGGGWQDTPEVYAGIVFAGPLNPTVTVARDFDLGDGSHVLLSVSQSVPVGEDGVSLDFAGSLDYNAEYYTTETGLSYANVSAALSVPVGGVTLSPTIIIQRRLDEAFATLVPHDEVFGVTVAFGL